MESTCSGSEEPGDVRSPEHNLSATQTGAGSTIPPAGSPSRARAQERIRLRHLSCFVAVAQERTLARAAARLHLSQPAVSKTIAELEELAGRRLVERGRSGTQLTPAGEEFLRYAADVTTVSVCSTSGGEAKCGPTSARQAAKFSEPRKSTV